ncbi:MAG: adenylosuccinate lyase, partial [Planctomycetes bacterium]|nr:adenylosuccinate lyase [Planctomycetota bacterium]
SLAANPAGTAACQWFERTLDDSANRRLSIPEAFMATEVILATYHYVAADLVVNDGVIDDHVRRELPFMATENILMEAVKAGGDRQELHELIRQASHEAAAKVKAGGPNDLFERLSRMPEFECVAPAFAEIAEASKYTGRSSEQVGEFLEGSVRERLAPYGEIKGPETPQV